MMEEIKIKDEQVGKNALSAIEADELRGRWGPSFAMREPQNELKKEAKRLADERSRGGDGLGSNNDGVHMGIVALSPPDCSGDATMNLANNFSRADKEVCFDQPFLIYGAKKYKSAITKNPKDHDEVYSWGLALQESAASCGPDSGSSKDVLLEEACKRYEEATQLYAAHYNAHIQWADALFERAKLRSRTKEAEELWKQAANKYEEAVQLNWNSPQALNNWGLALQELSAIALLREKEAIARIAIRKYRAAIRLEFDFCGAIYNLGTILYDFAEDAWRCAKLFNVKQVSHDDLYSQAALFIAAAHALKPNNSVYLSALRLVHSTLPLPYFKVGYLTTPPANNPLAPHQDWDRSLYVLNHERLQQGDETDEHLWGSSSGKSKGSAQIDISRIKIDVPDIVSVSACADVTLPQGAGLCVTTIHHPIFLVADTWESLEVWLDALRLVCTISARGKSDVLASVIAG